MQRGLSFFLFNKKDIGYLIFSPRVCASRLTKTTLCLQRGFGGFSPFLKKACLRFFSKSNLQFFQCPLLEMEMYKINI